MNYLPQTPWHRDLTKLAFTGLFLLSVSGPLGAATTIPYMEDFNDGLAQEFSASPSYTVEPDGGPGAFDYQAVVSTSVTGGANASSAVQLTNLVGNDFTISTTLMIDAFLSPSTSTVNGGLGLFGSGTDFSTGFQYRLLYMVSGPTAGRLQLSENGTGTSGLTGTLISPAASPLAPVLGTEYTLTVTGTYSGGNLTLNGSLTDGVTTLNVTGTDTSPQAGQFFGYRTAVNLVGTGTASINVDYDNFSAIAGVPEPGISSLLLLGAMTTFMRRRR